MLVAKLKGKTFNDGGKKLPLYIGTDGRAMEMKEQARKFESESEAQNFVNHDPRYEGNPPELEFEPA